MRRNPRTRSIGEHVHDFKSADRFLGSREERTLANNTVIYRTDDDNIGVRLHRTTIVRYFSDGRIMLDSGGWRTVTTKQRINQLLPAGIRLSQHKREWTINGEEFRDGMVIHPGIGVGEGYASNPGGWKFATSVVELVYSVDHDQEVGSVDEMGWYGMVSGMTRPEAEKLASDLGVELEDNEMDDYSWPLNAIISEDEQGNVEMQTYASNRDMIRAWRVVEDDYRRFYRDQG